MCRHGDLVLQKAEERTNECNNLFVVCEEKKKRKSRRNEQEPLLLCSLNIENFSYSTTITNKKQMKPLYVTGKPSLTT